VLEGLSALASCEKDEADLPWRKAVVFAERRRSATPAAGAPRACFRSGFDGFNSSFHSLARGVTAVGVGCTDLLGGLDSLCGNAQFYPNGAALNDCGTTGEYYWNDVASVVRQREHEDVDIPDIRSTYKLPTRDVRCTFVSQHLTRNVPPKFRNFADFGGILPSWASDLDVRPRKQRWAFGGGSRSRDKRKQ
jgi:hypothetical protein